jgi:hypothetical protein
MAQLDTSIYNAFAPKIKSVAEYDAEANQGELQKLNLLRGRQETDAYARKVGQENALRTFQQGLAGQSRAEMAKSYRNAGFLDQANSLDDAEGKYQTAQADIKLKGAQTGKAETDAAKSAFETRIKAHDFAVQRVSLVQTPQDAVGWAQEAFKAGVFGDPNEPATQQRFQQGFSAVQQIQTPQQLEEWKRKALAGGMDAKAALEREHAAKVLAETQRHNKSTEGIQIRGQDISAETARRGQSKAPPGYRFTPDGNMEAVPGGPADLKKQGALNADKAQLDSATNSMDRLAVAANEALSHPGLGGITGWQSKLPNAPGSQASDAQAKLNTLKSQVAFGVLQDMRNASKTGGALGAVSDKEGAMLQANIAALENAQSTDQMKESLKKIIKYSEDAKDRMRGAYNIKHGDQGGSPPAAQPKPAAGKFLGYE